jgi:hypothetical protein
MKVENTLNYKMEVIKSVALNLPLERKIENILNMELFLKKYGWIIEEKTTSNTLNRLTFLQWIIQLSGWIYIVKTFVLIFLIDDQSEWNYFLGDFSPAVSKFGSK